MYAQHFGLHKEPFSIAPDPRFLYMSEQHREALAHLLYGLGGGGGFVLLTGEIGAGKTTVCRCFLEQVPAHVAVAYVFNPRQTVLELLQTVCAEFGLPAPQPADSVKAHVDALNGFLLAAHAQGRQAVLVIDEAQNLSAEVLEQLRLLTNLETTERKLLQIVLIGQPELRDMLARPELEQLAQRVIARYHLGVLSEPETQAYIRHRIGVVSSGGALPFTAGALARIHRASRGVPRRINLVADRALLGAYAQGRAQADQRTVRQAAREVLGTDAAAGAGPVWQRRAAWLAVPALAAGAAALVGAAWWAMPGSAPAPTVAAAAASAAVGVSGPAEQVRTVAAEAPTTTAAAPAAGSSAVEASPAPPPADPAALLAAAHTHLPTAWRELALHWNVAIGEGEACSVAAQARLACLRSTVGGLTLLRQLDRPAILSLRGADGVARHAVLVALDTQQATLQVGTQRWLLTLPALASVWQGDLATFWRTPPAWREDGGMGRDAASRDWLDQRLAAAGIAAGPALRERVRAFQIAQGLAADGLAGPMTLMHLGRVGNANAGAADEPRLPASL